MGQSTSIDAGGSSSGCGTPIGQNLGNGSTSNNPFVRGTTLISNELDFIHSQIRRHSLTLRQLTMLTYDDLQSKIKELNQLSGKFVDCNGKQLIFEQKENGGGNSSGGSSEAPLMLYKGLIRIRCMKINPITREVETEKSMNLKQFLQIYNTFTQMHGTLVLDSVDSDDGDDDGDDDDNEDKEEKNKKLKEQEIESWDETLGDEAAASSNKNTPRKRPVFNMSTSLILDEMQHGGVMSPSGGEECCICMEEKHQVTLPCAHSYCLACIEQWNVNHKTCPICREILDTDDTWVLEDKPNTQDVEMEIKKSLFGLTK